MLQIEHEEIVLIHIKWKPVFLFSIFIQYFILYFI